VNPIVVNASEHSRWQLEARGPVLQRVIHCAPQPQLFQIIQAGSGNAHPKVNARDTSGDLESSLWFVGPVTVQLDERFLG
jgi:hypothetical protein